MVAGVGGLTTLRLRGCVLEPCGSSISATGDQVVKAHPVLEGMGNQKVSQMGVGVSDPGSPLPFDSIPRNTKPPCRKHGKPRVSQTRGVGGFVLVAGVGIEPTAMRL